MKLNQDNPVTLQLLLMAVELNLIRLDFNVVIQRPKHLLCTYDFVDTAAIVSLSILEDESLFCSFSYGLSSLLLELKV